MIDPLRKGQNRNNKRHHFLSVTYMKGFVDSDKRVWAYLLETPGDPLRLPPTSIGFEKYYYSQKLPEGGQENHRFEDLWNVVETVWPTTLRALRDRRLSPAISFNVLGLASIMKVRVPAARDRNALLFAAKLRSEVQALEEIGKLPEELQRYAGMLDKVPVGVDPQQTLGVIFEEMKQFGDLCFQLGFEVLHNETDLPFITSDNPVCIYDPRVTLHARTPYEFKHEAELIFPLDAKTLLRGSSRLKPANQVIRHRRLRELSAIKRLNRTVAQFAYKLLIARDRSCDSLAVLYADKCPTVSVEVKRHGREIQIIWRNIFGPRPQLSPLIDTPVKAARLEAEMAAHGLVTGKWGNLPPLDLDQSIV
jgi:hypothetical protein